MFAWLQPRWLTAAILVLTWAGSGPAAWASEPLPGARPNILLVLADDLGFSDLGCYGGEIDTPNLDALARDGIRFTQFYNTGRCWPTRASLLTGYYPQGIRRDQVPGVPSGGGGRRPEWAPLTCQPLQTAGYRSYHSGKWHIDSMPIATGFDRSYYLGDQHRFFSPTKHWLDDQPLPAVSPDEGYYATTAIVDHAVAFLEQHHQEHPDEPFFQYLAFTAPHFPLHAPRDDIAKYQHVYRAGWESIRQARWARIQEMDLVRAPLSETMPDVGPPYDFPKAMKQLGPLEVNRPVPWSAMSREQQAFQADKMAIHAAMVDRMDRELGRVLDQIRAMGQWDNTIILFLSDNGASAEIMVRGDGHDRDAPPGSWRSHLCLGPGWSTVANTPFRYHKTWTHEGGIATPLVVHWPRGINTPGQLRRTPGHAIDVWPTLLELAGAEAESSGPPRPGQSLVDVLAEDHSEARQLWWSHEGNRAFRDGRWKIAAVGENAAWELYDLETDRAETRDLAGQMPEKTSELAAEWQRVQRRQIKMATELYDRE